MKSKTLIFLHNKFHPKINLQSENKKKTGRKCGKLNKHQKKNTIWWEVKLEHKIFIVMCCKHETIERLVICQLQRYSIYTHTNLSILRATTSISMGVTWQSSTTTYTTCLMHHTYLYSTVVVTSNSTLSCSTKLWWFLGLNHTRVQSNCCCHKRMCGSVHTYI